MAPIQRLYYLCAAILALTLAFDVDALNLRQLLQQSEGIKTSVRSLSSLATSLTTMEDANLRSVLDEKKGLANVLKQYGIVSNITLQDSDGFNPSILPLPPGSTYPFWVVFRRLSAKQDGSYNELVSCFLKQDQGGDFRCETSLMILKDVLYNRTATAEFGNLGPEDPRVLFGLQGQPLMVYGNTSLVRNRGIWVRDLREAFKPHEFADHFPPGYFDGVPITVQQPTEFILPGDGWRKNIFPFNNFQASKMYLLDHYPAPEPSLSPYDELTGNTSAPLPGRNGMQCLTTWLGENEIGEVHGASNMLRIVLCNEDEDCPLTPENVVRFGMIHHRHGVYKNYSPLVVTMFDFEPFNYRSISPSLYFKGGIAFQYISSIQFIHTKNTGAGFSDLGYLDSQVIISLGVDDSTCGAVVVQAIDLLKDHYSC